MKNLKKKKKTVATQVRAMSVVSRALIRQKRKGNDDHFSRMTREADLFLRCEPKGHAKHGGMFFEILSCDFSRELLNTLKAQERKIAVYEVTNKIANPIQIGVKQH